MVLRVILGLLFAVTASATLNEVDKQFLASKNLLRNPGFENGKAGTSVTGGTSTLESSLPINGRRSINWDPSAADQYLNFGTITYYRWSPPAGKSGVAYCNFKSAYSEYTLQVYDGTNVIVEKVLTSAPTAALVERHILNFFYPTDTTDGAKTLTFRLKSTANAVAIMADDCFLGVADEVNVSPIKPTANLSATSDSSQTSTTSAPKIYEDLVFSNNISYDVSTGIATIRIPGKYRINASTGCGTNVVSLGVYKNGTVALTGYYSTGNSSSRTGVDGFLSLVAGDTIDIRPTASTCASGTDGTLNFVNIELIDAEQGTAYRPDAVANSWSGYHDNTCSWARTNTAFGDPTADATCSFSEITNQNFGTVASYTSGGNNLPGIVFTPKRAGKYFVCAHFFMDSSATTGKNILVDGSVTIATGGNPGSSIPIHNMLCGIVTASSTSSKTVAIQTASTSGSTTVGSASYARSVDWNIFAIDQQLPAPLLVNSVTSNSSGVEGIHRAFITNTGTPTISSGDQSGDWIDSITDGAAGVVKVNFKAGVFSRKPACTAMCVHNGTNCTVFAYNNTVEPSTTAIELVSRNSAGTGVDEDIMLICMGPR